MKLLTLLLAAVHVLGLGYPGVRSSVDVSSLNEIASNYLSELISKIKNSTIEPQSYFFFNFFIPTKITISNITILDLTLNDQNSGFIAYNQSTNTIYYNISELNATVQGSYHSSLPVRTSGNFTLVLDRSNIIVPIDISQTQGILMAALDQMTISQNSFNIKFQASGFFSGLLINLFSIWPLNQVSANTYSTIFSSFSNSYNEMIANLLAGIDYEYSIIKNSVTCDFHLLNASVAGTVINLSQNGSFYVTDSPGLVSPVVASRDLPDFMSRDPFKIQLSEYFFNSMLWGVYANNSLNFFIPSESVPKNFPYVFTTTGLSKAIPNLSKIYGANLPVDLDCSVYNIPQSNISDAVYVRADVYCDFMVRISPSKSTAAFRLVSILLTSFTGSIEEIDDKIYLIGNLDQDNSEFTNFSLVNSNIGNFNTDALTKAINWYTYYLIMQINNNLSTNGLRIPIPSGYTIDSPELYIYPGALEISGNLVVIS